MTVPTLYSGPSTNRTGHAKPGERRFYTFLEKTLGITGTVEPERFPLGIDLPGKHARAVTPDYRLDVLSWRELPQDVKLFLELTQADRYLAPGQLPPWVRQKNVEHSESGKAFIAHPDYLARKMAKIYLAESYYPDLVIVLLTAKAQNSVRADPKLLRTMIDERLELWQLSRLRIPA